MSRNHPWRANCPGPPPCPLLHCPDPDMAWGPAMTMVIELFSLALLSSSLPFRDPVPSDLCMNMCPFHFIHPPSIRFLSSSQHQAQCQALGTQRQIRQRPCSQGPLVWWE